MCEAVSCKQLEAGQGGVGGGVEMGQASEDTSVIPIIPSQSFLLCVTILVKQKTVDPHYWRILNLQICLFTKMYL